MPPTHEPRLSRRIADLAPSATVAFADRVRALKREGADILSFTVGEPDFDTPGHICEAAARAMEGGFTHYTAARGIPELREAIARKSREENGIPCSPEDVMVLPTKFGIFAAMMAVIDRGDEVLVPEPAWVSYGPCIEMAGGRPVFVPSGRETGYMPTMEALAERVGPATKLVVLNTPSNPTGGVATRKFCKGMADMAADRDLLVMSDEVYEKLLYEGEHVSIASLDGMFDRTITVNGFSKAYAMTGWRLGWVVAPHGYIDGMAKVQGHSITCATSFAQKGGVAAMEGPTDGLKAMVEEFRARRAIVVSGLNAMPGISCMNPQGAFYAFPSYDYEMSSTEFSEFLLTEAGVAVTPGIAFGESGEGHFRLSYAASRETIQEGLKRMREALEGLG